MSTSHWNDFPGPPELKEQGSLWAQSMDSLILKVPSAIVPEEFNFLINPLHPDFTRISIENTETLILDKRISEMLKS